MIKRYNDFELHLSTNGQQLTIDINGRPTAINLPQPIKIKLKSNLSKRAPLAHTLTQDMAQFGYSLYDLIFVKEVRAQFQAYLNRRKQDEGVRVCINIQSGLLSDALWELLCDQLMPFPNYLALDARTPVIRGARIGKEVYLRELGIPLKLLVIASSPLLVERIDRDAEKETVEQALGPVKARKLITIDYLGFDDPKEANFDNLQEYLARQDPPYDVVHIIGHSLLERGEEGVTALVEPRTSRQQDVRASSLANLFRSRGVMLVILQSCQSGAVDPSALYFSSAAQQLVASGVPAVLAMQENIDQDIARYFIEKLYTQWLNGEYPFEDALTQARLDVYQKFPEPINSWAIPVFYICPGVQLQLTRSPQPAGLAATERQIEAALPRHIRVGKETELVMLIRTPTDRGLSERLGARSQEFEASPEGVKTSPSFDVLFPVDEKSGKLLPKNVNIIIESSDFDLPRTEERVQLRPQGDSVLHVFSLTPRREGVARVLIRIIDPAEDQVTLAQLMLKTQVRGGDMFETEYYVFDTVLTTDQGKSRFVEHIVIQLEFASDGERHSAIADIEEVSRYMVDYLRSRGFTVEPPYTGSKGGTTIFEIVVPIYQTIHDNEELLVPLFTTVSLALQGIHIVLNQHFGNESAPYPGTTIYLNGKPLNWVAEDVTRMIAQIQSTYPEEISRVHPQNSVKIKVPVPKRKRYLRQYPRH